MYRTIHMFSCRRYSHIIFRNGYSRQQCVGPILYSITLPMTSPHPWSISGPLAHCSLLHPSLTGDSVHSTSLVLLLAPSSPDPGDIFSSQFGWHCLALAQPGCLSYLGSLWGMHPNLPPGDLACEFRPSSEHWGSLTNQSCPRAVHILSGVRDIAWAFLAMTQRWRVRSEKMKWTEETSHGENS